MTIFRLNFLLKVAHILVCQNPSFISTPVGTWGKRQILTVHPSGKVATVSDKNSWDS